MAVPTDTPLPARTEQVASGTAASINAGEPVGKTLGSQYVATLATNKPVVGTDFMAGISTSTSNETASVAGTVEVTPVTNAYIWLISPKVPATFGQAQGAPSQTTYNALVGARVLLDKTNGVYTLLAADGSTNGCVVENLDITKYPGKVAFTFRGGLSYLA